MSDIVERLKEKIIVDAFVSGSISDGALCDRLIRERLDAADEIERLRAENETLRRDVRTAVMGDSAELQDVKRENEKLRFERDTIGEANYINGWNDAINSSEAMQGLRAENEKLREALKPFAYYASQIPDDISDTCSASGTVGDLRAAAAAIRESGE